MKKIEGVIKYLKITDKENIEIYNKISENLKTKNNLIED